MRKLAAVLTIVFSLMGIGTKTAKSHVLKVTKPVTEMSLKQQVKFYKRNIFHARAVIRFWTSPQQSWRFDGFHPAGALVGAADLRFHRKLLKTSRQHLKVVEEKYLESLWPAHHLLWLCIHGTPSLGTRVGNEASSWFNHDTGHNGHYGGLQMGYNWLGVFRGYADYYSQRQQERFAETGYKNSGYSRSWLGGQWAQTIGPCWKYA